MNVVKSQVEMDSIKSKNGVNIRLTEERWFHITEEHCEMAGYYFEVLETIENPDAVYEGNGDELLSVRGISEGKYIIAIYKELTGEDGFVITAFITRRIAYFDRRTKLWPR